MCDVYILVPRFLDNPKRSGVICKTHMYKSIDVHQLRCIYIIIKDVIFLAGTYVLTTYPSVLT